MLAQNTSVPSPGHYQQELRLQPRVGPCADHVCEEDSDTESIISFGGKDEAEGMSM